MSSEERIVRLQEEGGSDIERRLLASAKGDEMPDEKYRALVQWSAGAAATAEAAAKRSWVTPVVKGLGVIALVAASVGVFEYASSSSPIPSARPATDSTAASPPTATEVRPVPWITETAAVAEPVPVVALAALPDAPSAAPSPSPSAAIAARPIEKKAASEDVSLADQMKFIDDARTRLRQGDARGALGVLDDYERRFPAPAFKEEATVLRVSSLAKAGDRAHAKRIGEAFLNAHPSELYSRRVEAIVRSLEQDGAP